MTKTSELNDRLNAIKEFICDTVDERGYPPTIREICAEFDIKSTSSASYYLKKLADAGELVVNKNLSRGIALKGRRQSSKDLTDVPLIGAVTAGMPRLAFEDYEESYALPSDLFDLNGEMFMLTVEGSSMIEIGINDGDKILVRKQNHAESGQVVVALIEDGLATVKRFFKKGDKVWLHPENRYMSDIYPSELTILGVVVGLIRTQIR